MKKQLSNAEKSNIMLRIMQDGKRFYRSQVEKREKADIEAMEQHFENP